MSGFVYFLPREEATRLADPQYLRDALARHGIGDVLSDVRDPSQVVLKDVVGSGPDGNFGCVVACKRNDGEDPKGVGYYAGKQTWGPTFGSAWIGYASLPSPEWVARSGDSRTGRVAVDSFGRRWIIPVARRPGGKEVGPHLPTHTTYDVNLKPMKSVRLDAVELWDLSGRVWDTFNGETDQPLNDDELQTIALKALAWHYRIGAAEANAFAMAGAPIIDSDTVQRFFLSLIDWDILAARRLAPGKDDPPTGSDSLTGSREETPTGDQVEAS